MPPLQFSTRYWQNTTIYKKLFIFLNQMILDLFMSACNICFLSYYLEKTHAHDLWRLIYQFNKHLLTNHNKGIVLLIGLRNWRPRRQWNPCSIFVRAIHTGYRKLSNLTVYWELQRLFLDQLIVYKDFVKIFHYFRLSNPQ